MRTNFYKRQDSILNGCCNFSNNICFADTPISNGNFGLGLCHRHIVMAENNSFPIYVIMIWVSIYIYIYIYIYWVDWALLGFSLGNSFGVFFSFGKVLRWCSIIFKQNEIFSFLLTFIPDIYVIFYYVWNVSSVFFHINRMTEYV